jgi:DNA-binding CsgD family transcriptional regulator
MAANKPKRERAIYLPLTNREKEILQRCAKEAGMSQRELLRSLIMTPEKHI